MNIAILSKGEHLYSTQSILNAGLARNHAMEVLDPSLCTLVKENKKAVLYYCNEVVNDLHAVIPRIGSSNTFFGTSIVRHFESMGVFSTVTATAILQSRDKWICFQELSKAALPTPKTVLGEGYDLATILEGFGYGPVIIKTVQGTHGEGVILAESYQSAVSIIDTLRAAKMKFVIQEYIEESKGTDIRVIVVDGVVVAAMKRQSKAGDFRSNLHRGGSAIPFKLSQQEENLALKTARVLRLGVCGIDLLQSKRGPLVLEVNSTPGLEGIEKTTGLNISKQIISYIERNKRTISPLTL